MSDQQSGTRSEGCSSPESSVANNNVRGDYSGNSGSRNIMNVGNSTTTNHNYYSHGGTNSSKNYNKILQCLYTSEYESHRSRVREPVKGTCTWVTEHPKYTHWLENRSSGLLWLSADPGCGKSVIASFLVKHLEVRTDAIVCYFFFKDDNDEQKSAKFALCAILHQLFMRKKELCKFAEEEFAARGKRFTVEVGTLWRILVKAAAESGVRNVICVLDALDECEEVSLNQLVPHMNRLPTSQTSGTLLKFIATSRPYRGIERGLDSRTTTIRLRGEDEVNSTTADVIRVIDNGIKELELDWENHGGLGYLRDLLESSADRTFLWVSLVLEILKDSEECSREEYANIVSTSPRDLAEFYTKILDKSANEDKARRILNIVVAAARPLTLREMNVAFRMSPDRRSIGDLEDIPSGFQKTIKYLCGLFVRIIDSKVYLVHQTAREFLINGTLSGQGKWQYTLRAMDSSFILADICISYLSLEDFESSQLAKIALDTARYGSWGLVRDFIQRYAFIEYAARHWAGHFRDSDDRQMELFESTRMICEARSGIFLTWVMVYWQDSDWYFPFPKDFTHLMMATWLGQPAVVEKLLGEGDINARSERYGTALNIAALRNDEGVTKMLLEIGVNAYLGKKEYNILHTKRSELERIVERSRFRLPELERRAAEFLKAFCPVDTPGPSTLGLGMPDLSTPNPGTPNPRTPNPGTPNPVTPNPGTPNPVTPNPGTPNPGTPNPVTPNPGTPNPGTPNPGTPNPGTPNPHTQEPHTPDPPTQDQNTASCCSNCSLC